MSVGPIKSKGEDLRRPIEEPVAYVPVCLRIGRSCEGRNRYLGKQCSQLGQPFVVGTKGGSPARNAVGLVNAIRATGRSCRTCCTQGCMSLSGAM